MRIASRILPVLGIIVAAGCSGGGGGGGGGSAPPPPPVDRYRELDLASGRVIARDSSWSPASAGPDSMVFVLVPAGARTVGSTAPLASDETRRTVSLPAYWIAIHETTREQWQRIAGAAPWTLLTPQPAAQARLPATGMTYAEAAAALAAYAPARLALPTDDQWEAAVLAGSAATYPWGDDDGIAAFAAATFSWDGGAAMADGPQPVGSRQANAWGLHDGLGNVAEFASSAGAAASLRGGAWTGGRTELRPAARMTIPADRRHAGAGLRLVLVP